MADTLIIPACPEVLLQLAEEVKKPEPDIQVISELVNSDIGLYSTLLATVNSPVLGMSQQVESTQQAIMVLGYQKTFTLLQSIILRNSL